LSLLGPQWTPIVLTGPKRGFQLAGIVVGDLGLEQLLLALLVVLLILPFHKQGESPQKILRCQS